MEYSPSQVVIGTGAKQPLYNAVAALAEEGDEVVVPSPYWVTYPELAKYCGAKSVFVETKPENGESPDGTGDDKPENGENPEEKGAEESENAGTEKPTTKRR